MKRKRESEESRRRRWSRPGSGASTSPLFRPTPRREPDVGLYRMCIYSVYMAPSPGTYGTKARRVCVYVYVCVCVCMYVCICARGTREPDITRCGTSSILVRRFCTAISIFRGVPGRIQARFFVYYRAEHRTRAFSADREVLYKCTQVCVA